VNPMIRKELRQRMRERRAWILPSLYLIVLGSVVTLAYFTMLSASRAWWGNEPQGADVGTTLFVSVAYTQLAVLLIIAPVFSAGAITIEKEQRTLAALLTSLLSTREIWWGKFVAALLFQIFLLISAVPVLALAFAFGGVGWRELGIATLTTLVVAASLSAVGLISSAYFRRTIHATAVTYAVVIILTAVTGIAAFWLSGDHRERIPIPLHLNRIFTMSEGLFGRQQNLIRWGISLAAFLALGLASAVAAIAVMRRGGEQI